jgi:hypothetical protein
MDSARATNVERRRAEEGRLPVPPVFAVALTHGYRSVEVPESIGHVRNVGLWESQNVHGERDRGLLGDG